MLQLPNGGEDRHAKPSERHIYGAAQITDIINKKHPRMNRLKRLAGSLVSKMELR
jgi:hypothetical protein